MTTEPEMQGENCARALVDALATSRFSSAVAIVIVALVCFLPGFKTLGLIDGDEPGYVVAAREMASTGDFAGVRLQTSNSDWQARGAYWVEALALSIAGSGAPLWVYRVPSLIAAVLAALATWWLALAFLSRRGALIVGWFAATSGLLGLHARLATPDAMLLAATTLAAGALARAWLHEDRRRTDGAAALFWIGLGVGILAKGPVAPLIAAIAIVILCVERGSFRWVGRLRPALGLGGMLLIISPWLILIVLTLMQASDGGPDASFLSQIGVPFRVQAPPGIYLLLLPLLAGPAVTFLFLAFRWLLDNLRQPVVLFALAWGGPLWLLAELLPMKTPQNVLPAIPAVVLLAGAAIEAGASRIGGKISWFYSLGPAIWPPFTLIVVPAAFFFLEGRWLPVMLVALAAAAFLGPLTWTRIAVRDAVGAVVFSVITVAFIYLAFFGAFLPGLTNIRVGERLAATVAAATPCPNPAIAAAGYPEESLVFAFGPRTRLVDAWGAADFLNSAGCRIALIDVGQIPAFRHRVEDLGLAVVDRGQVKGLNLRQMRGVDIHLFTTTGAAE